MKVPTAISTANNRHKRRLKGRTKNEKRHNTAKRNKLQSVILNNTVINYSTHLLTRTENIVLNRGLGFVPTTRGPNIRKHNEQLIRFERTLQNFFFFAKHQSNNNTTYNKQPFTGTSRWQPAITNPHISKFVRDLNIHLLDTRRNKLHYNISKQETKALQDLKRNNSIVIKRADKGGCLVIMDRYDYTVKAENMLGDKTTYEEVDKDATQNIHKASNEMVVNLLLNKYIINYKQYKYLTDFLAKCPVFYGLPKIHKNNWPLRPIVSQINGPLSKLNEIVDTYLKPCVAFIPELLQDTTMFLNRLEPLRDISLLHIRIYILLLLMLPRFIPISHMKRGQNGFQSSTKKPTHFGKLNIQILHTSLNVLCTH